MGCGGSKSSGSEPSAAAPQSKPTTSPKAAEEPKPATEPTPTPAAVSDNKEVTSGLLSGNIKLIYFKSKGMAEPIRLMFALKKIKYEDVRMDQEQWDEYKPNSPWGYLPVLDIDGKQMGETGAIFRMVAKELGFDGKSLEEKIQIDCIISYNENLYSIFRPIVQLPEEERPAGFRAAFDKVAEHTERLEKMVAAKNGGWVVGDEFTGGDILLHVFTTNMQELYGDLFTEKFPALVALAKKVAAIPEISDWIEKRPVTKM